MEPKFEIYSWKDRQYYFRLRAVNNKILLTSKGYSSLSEAKKGITQVRCNAGISSRFKKMIAQNQKFYFILLAKNGKVICTSENYNSKQALDNAIKTVEANATKATEKIDVQSLKKRMSVKASKVGTTWLKTPCIKYMVPDDNNYPTYFNQLAAALSKKLYINGTQNLVVKGHQAVVVKEDQCVSVGKNQYHFIGDNQYIGVAGHQAMQVYGTQQISVGGDHNLIVDDNQHSRIGVNQTVNVGETYSMSTGNDLVVDVHNDYDLDIDHNLDVDVGNDYNLKVGKKLNIECGDEISITVGKCRVTLRKNGHIEIFGNKIDINSTNELNINGPKVRISGSMSLTLVGNGTVVI